MISIGCKQRLGCLVRHLQAVVTQINAEIGAKGVLSQECKTLVENYANIILDLLEQRVRDPSAEGEGLCRLEIVL